MYHLAVLDERAFIRNRVKGLLGTEGIRVYEAETINHLVYLLDHENTEVDLIMADLNFDDPTLVERMQDFRKKHARIPLVIFTSASTRKVFVSAVKMGASDFILKSTDEKTLIRRIKKNIAKSKGIVEGRGADDKMTLDVRRYLSGEIRKAQKGHYDLTFCFSKVVDQNDLQMPVHLPEGFYEHLQTIYWETDELILMNGNRFVSFFPFCGKKDSYIVESKLQTSFDRLKAVYPKLKDYELDNDYVTFPEDGLTKDEILSRMIREMKNI